MTILDLSRGLLSWVAGAALGAFFFGGLWWTIRRAMTARLPGVWFVGSLLLRMTAVVMGFYWLSGGHADRLLLGLTGFVAARVAVRRFIELPQPPHACSGGETGHAS